MSEVKLPSSEQPTGSVIPGCYWQLCGRGLPIVKIMPHPDDPSKFVIGVRDPKTGDIFPEQRRGSRRYVERGRDRVWRVF